MGERCSSGFVESPAAYLKVCAMLVPNTSGPQGCHGRKKPQPLTGRGKSAERIEVEFGPFRPAASRRAECLLVALPTSGDLFTCAKDLFVGAKHGWPAKLRHREPVFGGRAAAHGLRS